MEDNNPNSRLEAFCDGVFAIALTLLILDIRLPSPKTITTNHAFWLALLHIVPSILSFLLSFTLILITWVNHHAGLKLINGSSAAFVYGNGLLLLAVVFLPFPTGLLGDYLLTDHASPAVILYSSVCAFQAIGWNVLTGAALGDHLTKNASAALEVRQNHLYSYFAFVLYIVLAIVAIWFPLEAAIAISISWTVWVILGVKLSTSRPEAAP